MLSLKAQMPSPGRSNFQRHISLALSGADELLVAHRLHLSPLMTIEEYSHSGEMRTSRTDLRRKKKSEKDKTRLRGKKKEA